MSFLSDLTPSGLAQLAKYLNWGKTFPDYPPNFVPPAFADPNYVPPSRGWLLIIFNSVTTAVACLVVFARLAVRAFRSQRRLSWDDYFIILALIASIGYSSVGFAVVKKGCVGQHSYDCVPAKLKLGWAYRYGGLMLYITSTMLIKVSIAIFCARLAPLSMVAYRRVVVGTISFVSLIFLTSLLLVIFSCTPFKASWDLDVQIDPRSKCIPEWKLVFGFGILYSVTDLWLVMLPAWLVVGLSLKKAWRIGIIVIFSMGLIATACSVLKIKVTKAAYDTFDPTWHFVDILIYSQMEVSLGLICASLPALSFILAGCYRRTTGLVPKKSNPLQSSTAVPTVNKTPLWTSDPETQKDAHEEYLPTLDRLNLGDDDLYPNTAEESVWKQFKTAESTVEPADYFRNLELQRAGLRPGLRAESLSSDEVSFDLIIQRPEKT